MATVVEALKLSLEAAAAATLLAAPLGGTLGWAMVRRQRALSMALTALWVLPAPVLLYCFRSDAPALPAMSVLGILSAAPFIARSTADAFGAAMPDGEKALRSLGATDWDVFRRAVAPVAGRALLFAVAMGFVRVAIEALIGLAVRR